METPEILLTKVSRYKFLNGTLPKMPWPLEIPEYLDLGQYVEKSVNAGMTALL